MKTNFSIHVAEGLQASPKHLSSKYIYDAKGDTLFQKIMAMPSYYLTDCELEILSQQTKDIGSYFSVLGDFDLIELGAGDGKKTKKLLKFLLEENYRFTYKPIDISQHAIQHLTEDLASEFPNLKVAPEIGEYFEVLKTLHTLSSKQKVILFLGSNIGNLPHHKAIEFLTQLGNSLHKNDMLFMGFDQKKHPQKILDAYNDPEGLTAAFNKNILQRINTELGGNFNLSKFLHWETYNPETGTAQSFLVSTCEQEVSITTLNLNIHFKPWETIHTEISQKYDAEVINWLAKKANLKINTFFTDSKNYYRNYLFTK